MNIGAIQRRIDSLRRELREVRVQIKISHRSFGTHDRYINHINKIRYDQMEELSAELHRQKLALSKIDMLEDWCEMNPSDLECRMYDS